MPTRAASRTQLIAWVMYDWASNAYAAIVLTFVFAAYFTEEVVRDAAAGTVVWGIILGATGVVVALGGPLVGATADQLGRRRPWLATFTLLCVGATALLWFVRPEPEYLWLAVVLIVVGELAAEYAGVLYNAMLASLAPRSRVGRWSGWGWSAGYAGGLLCLLTAYFVFVGDQAAVSLERDERENVRAAFPLAGAWYLVFALPLLWLTPDGTRSESSFRQAARDGTRQLMHTLRHVRRYKEIVKFLVARLIYIDGLAALFMFGGVYAAGTFQMSASEVLLFGIALNISAGVGALAFAWIDDRIGGRNTVLIALIGIIVPATAILMIESQRLFWLLALLLGIFVGPVQAGSRSLLSRVAPEALRHQMFGLYALSGKVAFFCPLLVALLTWLSGSQRVGMSAIVLFMAAGFVVMLSVPSDKTTDRGSGQSELSGHGTSAPP